MYKLEYYVPKEHLESVNLALFEAGAGKIGNYDCCCWVTEGRGQFRPLSGSNPFVGEENTIHTEAEWKVELVFEASKKEQVVHALKAAHPYEEVAYQLFRFER